ncbi:VanZ family protein [Dubosiella newyorkensis]|uniref:VanZ family protein n=1 Tax=Dubosiella newyorkensis TaxID=1862672 RepID=UPI00248A966A|nr:VanZ family protein [Dubosiella newyorkensis]
MINTVEFLTSFLPYFFLLNHLKKKGMLYISNPLFYLLVTFGVYIAGMLHFTDPSTIFDILDFTSADLNLNFVPFSTGISKIGYVLNVVLFVPFGVLIPLLFKEKHPFLETMGCGFLGSLFIEFSQLFNERVSDVDDLIMNTFGVFIGWLIYFVFFKKIGSYKLPLRWLFLFIFVLNIGRFFLFYWY